jgi:drug/metabolite transporter (DMT)-like permease
MAAIFDAITFKLPFYTGDWNKDKVQAVIDLAARTTTVLTILTVVTGALALLTIFLYNNRKLQLKLSYLGVFLTAVLLTMYLIEMGNFSTGSIAIWAIIYFAILVFYLLAIRGIMKDEKLIKSLDRLR